jgi:hypothetical protein
MAGEFQNDMFKLMIKVLPTVKMLNNNLQIDRMILKHFQPFSIHCRYRKIKIYLNLTTKQHILMT